MPNRIPVAQRGPLILAIDKTISINGTLLTVIGVMPEAFHGITQELEPPDIWVPVTMIQEILLEPDMLTPRMLDFKHMVARRSSYSQYAADQAWLDRQIRDYVRAGEGASLTPARQKEIERISVRLVSAAHGVSRLRSRYGDSLKILMAIVAVVLLIACAAAGLILGIPIAEAAARLIRGQLYQMSPFDPGNFIGATAAVAAVTVLSACSPRAEPPPSIP